jgi:hypothetical protein
MPFLSTRYAQRVSTSPTSFQISYALYPVVSQVLLDGATACPRSLIVTWSSHRATPLGCNVIQNSSIWGSSTQPSLSHAHPLLHRILETLFTNTRLGFPVCFLRPSHTYTRTILTFVVHTSAVVRPSLIKLTKETTNSEENLRYRLFFNYVHLHGESGKNFKFHITQRQKA